MNSATYNMYITIFQNNPLNKTLFYLLAKASCASIAVFLPLKATGLAERL